MKPHYSSIKFDIPVFIQGQGKRSNQEDAYFPIDTSSMQYKNCFIICDGVGGQNKGEVASSMLSQSLGELLQVDILDIDIIKNALRITENKMTKAVKDQNELEGMSTTLVLLVNTGTNIITAHVGDSRIYQFRNGKVLYKSKDHSLVEELVAHGSITEAAAVTHPRRNVITRSVSGNGQNAEIDFNIHLDLKQDDLFLLCTDGVLESWTDVELRKWSNQKFSLKHLAIQLETKCKQHSTDNYTACLLQIKSIIEISLLQKLKNILILRNHAFRK